MARAVAQRKQIPYLLIVFVFLFFIAAIMAVVKHTETEELDQNAKRLAATLDEIALDDELRDGDVARMLEDHRRAKEKTPRLVPQFQQRIQDLVEVIGGQRTTYENGLALAKAARDKYNTESPLISLVDEINAKLQTAQAALAQTVEHRRQDQESATQDILSKDTQISQLQEELDQRKEEIKALQNERKAYRDTIDQTMEEIRSQFANDRRDLDTKIADLVERVAVAQAELKEQAREVERLTRELADIHARKVVNGIVVNPDAKIAEVVSNEIVYIDIGKIDNVILGLPFGVFPPSAGINEIKAKLVVTKVHEKTSECKVLELYSVRRPITVNDIVMDIAFSETRPYTFVIEGTFDLHGTGYPTTDDRDEAISMVRRFGGKVVDEVSPGVDYVVLGDKPDRPTEPSQEADPTIRQAYREKMKIFEAYGRVQDEAMRLGLPIMNANRFMDMMGYMPIQTLEHQ